MSKHTLSVLVENKPGVLTRIAALFSRRGYNIEALAVGETEHPEISRMTIRVDVDVLPLEQVTKQLNKLVEVLKVVELDPLTEVVEMFRAKVVDVGPDTIVVEATGNVLKLEALLRTLEPFGVKELVQSGLVAIGRGSRSITDRSNRG